MSSIGGAIALAVRTNAPSLLTGVLEVLLSDFYPSIREGRSGPERGVPPFVRMSL